MRKMTPISFMILFAMITVLVAKIIQFIYTVKTNHYDDRTSVIIYFGVQSICTLILFFLFKQKIKKHAKNTLSALKRKREEYYERRRYISKNYIIESAAIVYNQTLSIRLTFTEELLQEAMPIVNMNGIRITLQRETTRTALAYCKGAASATDKEMTLTVGKSVFTFKNPFQIDFAQSEILWQCEGHIPEKVILITLQYKLPVVGQYTLPFQLLVDGSILHEPYGFCNGNQIKIPIGSVDKSDCVKKTCELRLAYSFATKVILPAPVVMSVNRKPVSIRLSV